MKVIFLFFFSMASTAKLCLLHFRLIHSHTRINGLVQLPTIGIIMNLIKLISNLLHKFLNSVP